MIKLHTVSKQYSKDSFGLKNVNLSIDSGEFVSIVGQSGSGKTTLVKLLIAEDRVTSGTISIGGWDITRIPQRHIPILRRQIGVIFQDFKLLPQKTVYENVAFALHVSGEKNKRIVETVPRVLEIVGLSDKAHRYSHQLSGGEQQRVAIARALVHRPKILIGDEPTGNLDTINTYEIMDILKRINQFGTTVVLVTHDKDIVNKLHRRVITLQDGGIVSDEKHGKYRL